MDTQNGGLEKVTPLKIAIFGIYVRFLGCKFCLVHQEMNQLSRVNPFEVRDSLVPFAVRWYTGEACPDDGYDDDVGRPKQVEKNSIYTVRAIGGRYEHPQGTSTSHESCTASP